MRSFLDDKQVLNVAHELGWYPANARKFGECTAAEVKHYAAARDAYRTANGRLFPNWSEVFDLLMELGYQRREAA